MPRPRLQRPRPLKEIVETAILIGLVYTFVNLASVRFYIEGPSMQPNFGAGQFLIVSRVHYLFADPQRGDIVVFDPPGDDDQADDPLLIKRLIGMPGDTVELRDQQVYLNGTPLAEPYLREACDESRCRDNTWTLGADEYFFMGDNRNNSRDSRVFGVVTHNRIIGEAIVRYWPPQDIALVTRYRYPEE